MYTELKWMWTIICTPHIGLPNEKKKKKPWALHMQNRKDEAKRMVVRRTWTENLTHNLALETIFLKSLSYYKVGQNTFQAQILTNSDRALDLD